MTDTPNQHTGRSCAPSYDYRGVNHARMTKAMETCLRDMPVAFLVLSRLRRLVGDGNTITLYGGVRGWATWMDCSPGYPKQILNRLAHEGFITVVYLDDGFAEVTVLPPAELGDRQPPTDHPVIGSAVPPTRARGRAVPPQSRIRTRSISDRMSHDHESTELASELLSHGEEHMQKGMHSADQKDLQTPVFSGDQSAPATSTPSAPLTPSPTADLPPSELSPAQQAVLDGLLAQQIYPALARRILARHPDLTLADFERQVARLTARGQYAAPVFVVAKILARGETVAAPEPVRPAGPPRTRQPSDTIRFAVHITEEVRAKWLDLCAQHPAHTAQIAAEFLQRYPVPTAVEAA
jgi:hypothetical protein